MIIVQDAGHPEVLFQGATLFLEMQLSFPFLCMVLLPDAAPSVSSGCLNGSSVYDKRSENFARVSARALENCRQCVREAPGGSRVRVGPRL